MRSSILLIAAIATILPCGARAWPLGATAIMVLTVAAALLLTLSQRL